MLTAMLLCARCGRLVPRAETDVVGGDVLCLRCVEARTATAPVKASALGVASPEAAALGPFRAVVVALPSEGKKEGAWRRARWSQVERHGRRIATVRSSVWDTVWMPAGFFTWALLTSAFGSLLGWTSRHSTGGIVAGAVFVAIGLPGAYGGLVAMLNRARITLDSNEFRLAFGPVPQSGGVRRSLREIDQFFATEFPAVGGKGPSSWGVALHLRVDETVELRDLPLGRRDDAEFVAAKLNAWLYELRPPAGAIGP